MIVVLLGPPGSGKGTQSEMLLDVFGAEHICVGDILREEIAKGSELGLKAKAIIEKGNLLSDEDVFEVIKSRLKDPLDTPFIILDGYPRTVRQAELLEGYYTPPLKVIYFKVDADALIDRLENRVACKGCKKIYNLKTNPPKVDHICDDCGSTEFIKRADDSKEVILQRLKNYDENTKPLIDFYTRNGVLYNIDASKEKHQIHDEIVKIIQEL